MFLFLIILELIVFVTIHINISMKKEENIAQTLDFFVT